MATTRSAPNHRNSKGPKRPKLNTGGNETNLNDLVNFQLPPRRTHYIGPRRNNKKATTYTPWARERFINSAYRFILRPSVTADYTVHFVDPDIYFQWGDIMQILVPYADGTLAAEGNASCPICLSAPVAPRMTKCGHVYCYACILHYLQTGEQSGWHRCPICFDSISESGLKPVKWYYPPKIDSVDPSGSTTMRMRLMQRPQLTTLALPKSDTWPSELIPSDQTAFFFLPDIYTFAKFMFPTPKSLEEDFESEIEALKIDREDKISYADGLGASFTDGAIAKVLQQIEEVKALDVPSLKDAIASAEKGLGRIKTQAEQRANLPKFTDFTPWPSTTGEEKSDQITDQQDAAAQTLRELNATPTKQIKARRNVNPPPPSTSTYYFYQAANGSPTFLHPLDIRILLSHFGSYANFPQTIDVKVEACNEGTVNEDLRKRCRYLAHLPEAADVTFLETDLEQVVGKEALLAFDSALKTRRAKRKEKERKDERAKVRSEEKERERLAEEHWILKFSSSRISGPSAQSQHHYQSQYHGHGSRDETAAIPLEFHGIGTIETSEGTEGSNGARQNPTSDLSGQSAGVQPGVWGARSFASTLSQPAIGLARNSRNTVSSHSNQEGWDMDAAWHELEQARLASGGKKKKGNKIVLSLNGSGGALAGRRR